MSKKIYVCAPGGHVTGGPELLHQLVDCMRKKGADAHMLYSPFGQSFETPEPYAHYDISIADYNSADFEGAVVIIPEAYTSLVKVFPKSSVFVWWLSVDNYLGRTVKRSLSSERYKHISDVIRGKKMPVCGMKRLGHLVQSEYARIFLGDRGIASDYLTDYLNDIHLQAEKSIVPREDIIAYNPLKGRAFTQEIIAKNPNMKFVPIQNMTFAEVRELLQRTKVYIDFGNHPGKDRFPREAAMAGCCIVTGRRGSAANSLDVPIPEEYKIDETSSGFSSKLTNVLGGIFSEFEKHSAKFDDYRNVIKFEPTKFEEQVTALLEKYCQ